MATPFRSLVALAGLLTSFAGSAGCASRQAGPTAVAPAPAPVQYDMEPVKIQASRGADGMQLEAFDAVELFERAGVALSAKKPDEAITIYDKLLQNFPESPYARPALYNRGLAQQEKKDWAAAVVSFKTLIERHGEHADAKDGMFQLGATYAEMTNWPASIEVFRRVLERKDLTSDDRIEAIARRGFAQYSLGDLDTSENTFRSALAFKQRLAHEERLATDFYLAFSQYHLGLIAHDRFRKAQIRLPEAQMDRDLEEKARLLLAAQRAYIEAIKYGNPAWASAAGFQVGSLYEELYDAFMRAPVPDTLDADARKLYVDELHKKIRILLEKSLRWQRENLLMIERLGVNTDWAEKSKVAYAKLLKLLDPNAKLPAEGEAAPVSPPAAPPTPAPPSRDPAQEQREEPDSSQRRIL